MRSDLDSLMQQHGVDVILITGAAMHNPAMVYMTGVAHVTAADLLKKRGQEPVLFYNGMERDEAANTGLNTRPYSSFPYRELYQASGGDPARLLALRYKRMLAEAGVESGKLVLYGMIDAGLAHAVFSQLQRELPGLEIVGDLREELILAAMLTKDADEVERIRRMGEITVGVVGRIADWLSGHASRDGALVEPDGRPLTLGDAHRRINLWLAEAGAENPENTIFAIWHDAGVPHSLGNPKDVLRLGETIVFDIFPCEAGGGYFYDFTRTWCLGYAPDEAQRLYEDVFSVYRQLESELKMGVSCALIQQRACELFEAQGHPTMLHTPQTEIGFPHGLGHGVGINIHERPWFRLQGPTQDSLQPGNVFTLEPGLYYPERGLGVRLENTYYATPQGSFEILVDYPMDLVLPVRQK
jgi:Xaa-Pro aminopeptidase